MLQRAAVAVALILLSLPAVAPAAPPPDCTCDFCVPDPTAKCRLPGGGQTTCGIFMRSGICLDQLTGDGEVATLVTTGAAPIPADLEAAIPEPPPCATEAPAPELLASPSWTFEGCFAFFSSGPCFDVFRDSSGTLWICEACGTTKKPGRGSCQVLSASGFWCS